MKQVLQGTTPVWCLEYPRLPLVHLSRLLVCLSIDDGVLSSFCLFFASASTSISELLALLMAKPPLGASHSKLALKINDDP